jgi:TonB-dependent receptor
VIGRSWNKCAWAFGASTAVLAMASAAAAQTSATAKPAQPAASGGGDTVQEVVVTGFRSSLAKAISIKRQENAQVDTILAEDIGKFPDLNLAESLQRIPGVAITREGGEGRQITVRGLGPQYTRTRINGMEALATIGAPDNDGGVNRTRSFDFTVFDSDLFNSIQVHKTSSGDLDEGALGATVDLQTARPLDFHKPLTFNLGAKGDYNSLSGSLKPRVSGMLGGQTDDGKFAALASVSYAQRSYYDSGASTVRWDMANVLSTGGTAAAPLTGFGSVQGTNCQVYPQPAACVAVNSAFHPRFPRYDVYQNQEQRLGITGSLQWRPTDNHLVSLDYLHSWWYATRQESYLEAPGFSGTGKCSNPATCTSIANIAILSDTITNGVMTNGVFNGVDTRVEDRFDELHTNFDQGTLTSVDHWTSKFSTDLLLGVNSAFFQNPTQTTLGWDQYNVQGFVYDYTQGRIPLLNWGAGNTGPAGPWLLTSVRERPQTNLNDFSTAAGNAHYDFSDNLKLSAGVSYKIYTFKTTSLRLVNGETVTSSNAYAPLQSIAQSSFGQIIDLAKFGVRAPSGSPTSFFAPSVDLASTVMGLYTNTTLFALSPNGDLGNNAGVQEKDLGGYVQLDFETQLLGHRLRGNAGIRGVNTDENSHGYEFIANVLSPVQAKHNYANGLPSINLAYDAHDDLVLRFSAARVMTRPDLTSLVGSTSVTVSGTSYSVKTGNPALNPFLANSYDLAAEWYPMRGAMLSVALFHKDILTQVTNNTVNIPFNTNPFGIPDSAAILACGQTPGCSPQATWAFTVPTNTSGGYVNGVELNYQQPFTFLPGLLTHTGVLANVTLVDSKVNYPSGATFVSNQLLGLSKLAHNVTLYYEDDKWSLRVSEAYRSRYLTRVPGQETGTDADGFNATFNVDASLQYTVNQHLKLTFEGVNLTDQYESQFNDTNKNMPYYYHHTGREFLFGFRFSY